MALNLDIHATDGVSGSIQFATNSTQVTRIVEGDRRVVLWIREFSFLLKVVDELLVVHHFDVLSAVILVFLSKGVEAVWA